MSGHYPLQFDEPIDPSLREIIADILSGERKLREAEEAYLVARAQTRAAFELSRQIAPLLGVSEYEAVRYIDVVPENMLNLLESPEGWIALASYVATQTGTTLPDYSPTLH